MVVKRYNNLLHYRRRPRPGSNHVLGKHGYVTTRSTSPGHSEANLRYHDAQIGAHGQKLAAADSVTCENLPVPDYLKFKLLREPCFGTSGALDSDPSLPGPAGYSRRVITFEVGLAIII